MRKHDVRPFRAARALAVSDSLAEYFQHLKPHRSAVAGLMLAALALVGLQAFEPLFLRFTIDHILLEGSLDNAAKLARLGVVGTFFLGIAIASNLLAAVKEYRQRLLNTKVMLTLRRLLFRRLLQMPLPVLWDMRTGGILSRLSGDIETTTGLLQTAIVAPTLSLARLIVAVGILFALNWRLALTALAVIPGAVVVSLISARRVRPIYRAVRAETERIDGRVGETFGGIRVVRAFQRERHELLTYTRGRNQVLRKELAAYRRELFIWTGWGLLLGIVNVVIVWYGGALSVRGHASIGDIMAFQWYTFLLLNPVWQIVNALSDLQRAFAAMERVFELLRIPADKPDRPGAVSAPVVVRELLFEKVDFAYQDARPVMRQLDLAVAGGSVVAIVGRSGAGKTTLTDLVARFHDPTRGRILLNGMDIRDIRLDTYRRLLAIVRQEVFLFDGSVRENIAYGRHDASDAEIEDAARRANALEFILRLPDGFATTVGERGVRLSGGQQQRLAIARAMLANPQILILDEATSNLDTESERLIQASLETLFAGRTTFVIAHRLSTIRHADLILVLDDGRVTERGTHEDLMAMHGTYHAMVTSQAALVDSHSATFPSPA